MNKTLMIERNFKPTLESTLIDLDPGEQVYISKIDNHYELFTEGGEDLMSFDNEEQLFASLGLDSSDLRSSFIEVSHVDFQTQSDDKVSITFKIKCPRLSC